MNNDTGLISDWSGSVNRSISGLADGNTIQFAHDNTDSNISSIFELEAYALYKALTDANSTTGPLGEGGAEWIVVSSSYYDVGLDAYTATNTNGWTSVKNVRFPLKMSSNDTVPSGLGTSATYTPTEHPWILLKKVYTVGQDTKTMYLTIDCRYPTPPHKENVNKTEVLIKNTTATDTTAILLGASSVTDKLYSSLGSDYEETLTLDGNPATFPIGASFLSDKGIAIRDTSITKFNATSATTIHDYASRVVGFIDLVISDVEPVSLTGRYGTTSTRPNTNKEELIYCWGLDFIRNNKDIYQPITELDKYKYHINYVKNSPEFIFSISRNVSSNKSDLDLTSVFGIGKVLNFPDVDLFPYVSININCEPLCSDGEPVTAQDRYLSQKSVCINGYGENIEFVNKDSTSFQPESNLINNYFNTCYRNYNFRPDQSITTVVRKGYLEFEYPDLQSSVEPQYFPCFAPTKPSDSTIAALSLSIPRGYEHSDNTKKLKFISLDERSIFQEYISADPSAGKPKYYKYYLLPTKTSYDSNVSPIAPEISAEILGESTASLKTGLFFNSLAFAALNTTTGFAGSSDTGEAGIPYSSKGWTVSPENYLSTEMSFPASFKTQINDASNLLPPSYTATGTGIRINITKISAARTFLDSNLISRELAEFYNSIKTNGLFGLSTSTSLFKSLVIAKTAKDGSWLNLRDSFINNTNSGVTAADLKVNLVWPVIRKAVDYANTFIKTDVPNNTKYGTILKDQDKGADAFSVFKTLFSISTINARYEMPLVAAKYTFTNSNLIKKQDIYGVKENSDNSNIRALSNFGNIGYDSSYTEMPIFLMSARQDRGGIKGYVSDVYWVPKFSTVQIITVSTDPGAIPSKIVWKGWSMPWFGDQLL